MVATRTRRVDGVAGLYSTIRTRTRGVSGSIPAVTLRTRTRRISGSVPVPFAVSIDTDQDMTSLEPGTTVTLTADATGGSVTGWSWTANDSGLAAALDADGDTCTFIVPARIYGLITFTITATATGTGAAAGDGTITGAALPHNEWSYSATGLVPRFLAGF